MELLNTAVSATLLVTIGVLLGFYMEGRFAVIDRSLADLKAYIDVRIDDTNRRIDETRDDVRGLRGDFTQLAFAVGGGKQPNTG